MSEQIYQIPNQEIDDTGVSLLKLHKKKLGQLQNKAFFFQGQINPLFLQNKKVKEQLVNQNRIVLITTQLLRNLLLIGTDSNRKLKLDMANLQEIAEMISEDWLQMKSFIEEIEKQLLEKGQNIVQLEFQYNRTVSEYNEKIKDILQTNQVQVTRLVDKNEALEKQVIQQKELKVQAVEQMKKECEIKLKRASQMEREYGHYRHEMGQRCRDYERATSRLRGEIESNLREFEDSKKHLKQIYDKIMQEKIQEISERYDLMLEFKNKEKAALLSQVDDIEELMRSQMENKGDQIARLRTASDRLKKDVQEAKDQIWKKKTELQEHAKTIKQSEQEAFRLAEDKKALNRKILIKQEEIDQIAAVAGQEKRALQKKLDEVVQETTKQIATLKSNKSKLEKEATLHKSEIRNLEGQMSDSEKNLKEKLQIMQGQWEEKVKKVEQELRAVGQELSEKSKELETTIQKHEEDVKHLIEVSELEVKKLEQENMQKTQNMIRMHDHKMVAERQLLNDRASAIHTQNLRQISSLEKKYRIEAEETEITFKRQKAVLEQANAMAQLQREMVEKEKEEMRKGFTGKILELKEEAMHQNGEIMKLERQKVEQAQQFEKKISDKVKYYEKEIFTANAIHMLSINQLQSEMMKEINMLKQSNNIQEIEDMYLLKISALEMDKIEIKEQLISECEDKIGQINSQFDQRFSVEMKGWECKLESQERKFNEEIVSLADRLEADITQINDDLLGEQKAHHLSNLTREQKISYLHGKVRKIQDDNQIKEGKLVDKELMIISIREELVKTQQIIEEKVRERKIQLENQRDQFLRKCTRRIKENDVDCKVKVQEIEQERVRHAEALYQEFYSLKERQQEVRRALKHKYDQLEKIFAERPSRAEDLSKIKELTEERSKLNEEVVRAQKKVAGANEIVKYLNLELENYKDIYGMFGPGQSEEFIGVNNGKSIHKLSPNNFVNLINNFPNKNSQGSENHSAIMNNSGDRPIKSVLSSFKKDFRLETQEKDKMFHSKNRNRLNTEEDDVKEFRIFPQLMRKSSLSMAEQNEEDIDIADLKSKMNQPRKIGHKKDFSSLDKSADIVINAEHFLGTLSHNKKAIEPIERSHSYGKRSKIRNIIRKKASCVINSRQIVQLPNKKFTFKLD